MTRFVIVSLVMTSAFATAGAAQIVAPAIAEGEPAALERAIQPCWSVPASAQDVTVQLHVLVDATGRPVAGSIALQQGWFAEPLTDAQATAFAAAQRAVVRCGQDGLPVPASFKGRDWPLALTFFSEGDVHAF